MGSGGPFARVSQFMYDKPSVLLGRKGTIDKPLYMDTPFWAVDTMYYTEIAADSVPKYVFNYSKCIPFDLFTYGSALPSMTQTTLHALGMPVPNLQDQAKIALFLDNETSKIDVLIEEQRRLINLLKEKRQAVISHAVTKGLNPDALKTPSHVEEMGEIPSNWKILRVRHVSVFTTSGPRGWSERISEFGRLFVQSGDLGESLQIDFYNCKRVNVEDGAESARTLLANGDIVVCITGAKTGNVAVCEGLDEPAFVNQHLCLIRNNSSILPRFLGLLLKSTIGQTYFEKSQYGMKQGLSLEDVRQAPVLLPPISEQREILSFLDSEATKFDELYGSAETAIRLLQQRRSALISAAVTGKIDVRDYTPKEAA